MSVGDWQPEPQPLAKLDQAQVARLLQLLNESGDELSWVSAELEWVTPLAKASKAAWNESSSTLEQGDLVNLIRFFTRLEQAQGWSQGADSPVIPLFKALKKQQGAVDRELVQWVKQNTDNKFLPFGPLL